MLIDADDRAQLRQELGRLELRSDGEGPFRVHVDSRHTHAALKAIDTPLTLVRTHMPSLEDAYLEIVGNEPVSEVSAILTLAHRDLIKLLRDRARMVSDFAFPLIFIGILGTSLQAGFGGATSFNLLHFVFTGVLAQTIWQSTALGVISLLMDREQDFSQEIFVSPISRYSIIFGKILGESLVAFPQFLAILIFGLLIGVPFTLEKIVAMVPAALIIAVYGGAFGVLVLSRLDNQRQANQIFPFVMLPQFFLAGIFNPIQDLPWFLDILTKIAPMRYAVDLMRDIYYGSGSGVPIFDLPTNLAIIGAEFVVFMVIGTAGFVRAERNR